MLDKYFWSTAPFRVAFRGLACLSVALAVWLPGRQAWAIDFQYLCVGDPTCSSFNANAYAGFQSAGARWSSLFSDAFTVRLQIGFSNLGANILGGANPSLNYLSYANYRSLLGLDRISASDNAAFASLGSDADVDLLINYTRDSPNGPGSPVPYLDNNAGNNNKILSLATANVKALGITAAYDSIANPSQIDAQISFNSAFSWDFDPSNGISAGSFDFIGVASHEIGHALGFISGVDLLDTNSPNGVAYYNADQFVALSSLDLFRYSAQSAAVTGGVNDWTADNRPKYFSLDRGVTSLALFSTGQVHGDGYQAGHWKDNLALGLLDPTFSQGELGVIRPLDVQAFDVIGYDLRSLTSQLTSQPVPGPLPLAGAASAYAWSRRLRRRVRKSPR
jgi:hypothetical protein